MQRLYGVIGRAYFHPNQKDLQKNQKIQMKFYFIILKKVFFMNKSINFLSFWLLLTVGMVYKYMKQYLIYY